MARGTRRRGPRFTWPLPVGVRLSVLGRRTVRSLHEPNYRRYFAGHAVSVVGTWMQRVGQDWLVLQLTGSALAIGVATALQFVPVLLAGLWGGLVVDRVDRRRLLMVTQAAQAVLAAVLAVLALTGAVRLWHVYVLALLLGVATVFDNPGRHAFVAELVGADDIANAQALNSSVHNAGRFVGPAAAGALIATTSVGVTFLVNAVSFVAVLLGLWRMDTATLRRVAPARRAKGQVREGLRYVWSQPHLRATLVLVAFVAVFGQNFRVVLPVLAADTFDGDARTYGWLTAMLGIGAVTGGLGTAAVTTATSWRVLIACVAFGVVNLLVAGAPTLTVALLGMVLVGVSNVVFNTLARALTQLNTSPDMQGRAMAIHGYVFLGSTPIGGPVLGALCELWGARAGLAIGGTMALVPAAVLLPALRRLRHRPVPSGP